MLPSDSPSLYRLSYRGSNLILRCPPDASGLRIPRRLQPQRRLPYEWEVAERNYIGLPGLGAKDTEGIDLALIAPAPSPTVVLRRRDRKRDRAPAEPARLALDAREPAVLFDHQVVAEVVAEGQQDAFPVPQEGGEDLRLREVSDRLAIAPSDRRDPYRRPFSAAPWRSSRSRIRCSSS